MLDKMPDCNYLWGVYANNQLELGVFIADVSVGVAEMFYIKE
jgi:hypothetical protein